MARQKFHHGRCRTIVGWGIAGFVVLQLGLGVLVDTRLPQVRDPEYTHREKLLADKIAAEPDKPVVVVLGSSRVLNGLDAATATKVLAGEALVFNFGIPSSGPFLEKVCLERLLDKGIKPDVVLIEVLPAFFNGRGTNADETSLDGARLTAREVAPLAVVDPLRRWALGRMLPTYRHQAELRALLQLDCARDGDDLPPDLRATDAFGWQPRGFTPDQCAALKGLAHRQYDECYRDFRLSSAQATRLETLLWLCQSQRIRTALVLTPEGSEFRRLYTPEMSSALDALLADWRARFDVPVIDARAWIADEHFYDMHHLQPDGARVFAARLATEGLAPLLAASKGLARRSLR